MRRHPFRSRAGLAVVALIVLATFVSGCGAKRTETNAYGWKASSHDATTLTIIIVTGVNDTDAEATVVSESATAVVIDASYHFGDGTGTANGLFRYADVHLAVPIGNREVRNPDGTTVPEQTNH